MRFAQPGHLIDLGKIRELKADAKKAARCASAR